MTDPTVLAVPILRVADVDASLPWWARLGFVEELRHVFEPGLPRFVGIVREGCRVYLSEHTGDAPGPSLVYLWVPDVDGIAADLEAEVEEVPWARECEVTDPDGNRVRVATPV
jgi:catechol 2,3-dioxygenase-like lactoylglutathione lyase family enzyme